MRKLISYAATVLVAWAVSGCYGNSAPVVIQGPGSEISACPDNNGVTDAPTSVVLVTENEGVAKSVILFTGRHAERDLIVAGRNLETSSYKPYWEVNTKSLCGVSFPYRLVSAHRYLYRVASLVPGEYTALVISTRPITNRGVDVSVRTFRVDARYKVRRYRIGRTAEILVNEVVRLPRATRGLNRLVFNPRVVLP